MGEEGLSLGCAWVGLPLSSWPWAPCPGGSGMGGAQVDTGVCWKGRNPAWVTVHVPASYLCSLVSLSPSALSYAPSEPETTPGCKKISEETRICGCHRAWGAEHKPHLVKKLYTHTNIHTPHISPHHHSQIEGAQRKRSGVKGPETPKVLSGSHAHEHQSLP